LRIATELHLKRLIVGGIERVYEIGRIFRNEGISTKHNPEFTMVELYEAYADYHDMMDLFESLLSEAAMKLLGSYEAEWHGVKIDLTPGWPRSTMADTVKEFTGVDFMSFHSTEDAVNAAGSIGVKMPEGKTPSWGDLLYECFDLRVENKLIQPVFVMDYPVEVSPLAKKKASDPRLTERFELFICRSEMGNAFSELNDPIDQKQRFMRQAALRESGDLEAGMMDEDYINALEYGMPPTGGLGIGIDRCVMMLTDNSSIRDVILFPTMKPTDD
jgi:lysyl-tRNA synthetase class 2